MPLLYPTALEFPRDVHEHLAQFDDISNAWARSNDGAAMLWLARSMADTDYRRGSVERAAAQAAHSIDALIEKRKSTHSTHDDPVLIACFHTKDAAYAAAGVEEKRWPEPGPRRRPQDELGGPGCSQGQRAAARAAGGARGASNLGR